MRGRCDRPSGIGGGHSRPCGRVATFVARNTWDGVKFETCGMHLTSMLNEHPIKSLEGVRFIVVPFNPNVALLEEDSMNATSAPTVGATLVDTSKWTRLAEIDATAARFGISRAKAVERLVNHCLSNGGLDQ